MIRHLTNAAAFLANAALNRLMPPRPKHVEPVAQATWDCDCANVPGLLSPGVVAADFDLWEREVAR